jgi:hypothetical protein
LPGQARAVTTHLDLHREGNGLGERFTQRLLEAKADLVAIDAAAGALDAQLGR